LCHTSYLYLKFPGKKQGKAVESDSQSDDEDDSEADPFEGAKPDSNCDSDPSEEITDQTPEEDTFIVEDDDGAVVPELPSIFSMNTHQDLAHHFKIICQLFVHLAVSPARKRHDLMQSVQQGKV